MDNKLLFGILSSTMGTITIFPQCYKTVKTGKADDISFWSIFFFYYVIFLGLFMDVWTTIIFQLYLQIVYYYYIIFIL